MAAVTSFLASASYIICERFSPLSSLCERFASDLKDSEQSVDNGVKVGGGGALGEVELAPKELHAQQGEDEDEEEEEEEKGEDGGDGVHEGHHQVPQARPVPTSLISSYCLFNQNVNSTGCPLLKGMSHESLYGDLCAWFVAK